LANSKIGQEEVKLMKKVLRCLMLGVLLTAVLAGCAAPAPEVIEKEVEVTRVVEKEVEVSIPEAEREWELVNPEGVIAPSPLGDIEINARPASLEGKTVMLHWNAKPNGDNVLNRVAELLTEQVQNITILKDWELIPEVAVNSGTPERSAENMAKIAEYKPDLVIGSQCD
jgi:hypothetical protein